MSEDQQISTKKQDVGIKITLRETDSKNKDLETVTTYLCSSRAKGEVEGFPQKKRADYPRRDSVIEEVEFEPNEFGERVFGYFNVDYNTDKLLKCQVEIKQYDKKLLKDKQYFNVGSVKIGIENFRKGLELDSLTPEQQIAISEAKKRRLIDEEIMPGKKKEQVETLIKKEEEKIAQAKKQKASDVFARQY